MDTYDVFFQTAFLRKLQMVLMKNGKKALMLRIWGVLQEFGKFETTESFYFFSWIFELIQKLRFGFLLKPYYYRIKRGQKLINYRVQREFILREYFKVLQFVRKSIFLNKNLLFIQKLNQEFNDFLFL